MAKGYVLTNDDGTITIAGMLFSAASVIDFGSGDVTITHSTNKLTFAGASSGYIFSDGNVGIGTTNPDGKLNVSGGTTWTTNGWLKAIRIEASNALEFSNSTTIYGMGNASDALYYFYTTTETSSGDAANYYQIVTGGTNPRVAMNSSRLQGYQGADVASANDLTLGNGNAFEITGTTQINAITTTNWQNGSIITLMFASALTVKHNTAGGAGTAPLYLVGSGDFSATAEDTLTLILSEVGGVQRWRELCRGVI